MEKELKITQVQANRDPDVDELYLLINSDHPQSARNVLADDDHGIYLRLDLETDQIVGALVFHASEWFEQIARAFQNQDFGNREVRFFLEKKLEELARQRQPPELTNPR